MDTLWYAGEKNKVIMILEKRRPSVKGPNV